jgi:hypothetical protein
MDSKSRKEFLEAKDLIKAKRAEKQWEKEMLISKRLKAHA